MKTIFSLVFITLSICSFSQNSNLQMQKDSLILKSRKQKTGSWVLMGTGMAVTLAGVIISLDNTVDNLFAEEDNSITGEVLVGAGLVIMGGGIYSLVIANKNKKKAMSIRFDTEKTAVAVCGGWTLRMQPAVKLTISLGRK